VEALRLEVAELQDADHWRWLLTDPDGGFLADHQVELDRRDPEYVAFADLAAFLRRQADPERRLASEAELVARVGDWIGRRVLGPAVGRAMVEASPAVVRVMVPAAADFLLYRPLELAHAGADGGPARPLAVQDVSLVFEVEGEAPAMAKQPVGDELRMLAVFSLPSEGTALALRRERYQLVRVVRRVAGRQRRAVELHVLQYGVTRRRLEEALSDGRGWDVLHVSGHGLAGGLLLERPDGTGDLLHTPELVRLLRPARRRLKLVALSSCQSAAATAAETRRWLELVVPQALEAEADAEARQPPLPALARELVGKLGCTVLAMRYPVVDDFAIDLDERVYEGLLGRDQDLPRALQLALPAAVGGRPTTGAPALSVATPTLVGSLAASLRLRPPPGQPNFNVDTQKMDYFPHEPERFVGRAGPMARASAALAPANRHVGVLFHGMAGAGKTACALELAYRHETSFGQLVWWQAPELGREIATSLRDLAVALETQLPGLVMVPSVDSADQLARLLPRLTQLLEEQAVLLVLDNLESLLTDQGAWRDPRWASLLAALTGHRGESRVVLTSRVPPSGLDEHVQVQPVHALSLNESLLLARELPNLGHLVREDPATRDRGEDVPSGWSLVRRTLALVQGHPKLLELADAVAADPAALAAHLAAADQATAEDDRDRLVAFFDQGETELAAGHFVRALGDWTRQATTALPGGAALLFGVLCCLEDADRVESVVDAVWPGVLEELGQAGEPPVLTMALAPLVERGLVATEADPVGYRVHPGVAEAGRAQAGGRVQRVVDQVLARYWKGVFARAIEAEGGEVGGLVLRAGRGAAPYLLRLEDWAGASRLLQQVLFRDHSPATVQAVLPLLRRIAEATRGSDRELADMGVLAGALREVQPDVAEAQLRELRERAVAEDRHDLASSAAVDLIDLLRHTGRLEEALRLTEQAASSTRRAGAGPWTQLDIQGQRLRLLAALGRDQEVLTEIRLLENQLATLPERSQQPEAVQPWSVREDVFDTARLAASNLGRWPEALAFNAEVLRSLRARGATDYEVAFSRFNDYFPLLRLGELDSAERLLRECREVSEAEGDLKMLGKTLSALADLEAERGRPGEAVRFEEIALRYKYAVMDPVAIPVSHHNLATHLWWSGGDRTLVLAHRLAAALIWYRSASGQLSVALETLANDVAAAGAPPLAISFGELSARVGQVEGVRLSDLVARLPRRKASDDEDLAELLRLARAAK
jgi:tetratricopeptide (TPR) repeat protein